MMRRTRRTRRPAVSRRIRRIYIARGSLAATQPGVCSQCRPGHNRGDGRCERHGKVISDEQASANASTEIEMWHHGWWKR